MRRRLRKSLYECVYVMYQCTSMGVDKAWMRAERRGERSGSASSFGRAHKEDKQ